MQFDPDRRGFMTLVGAVAAASSLGPLVAHAQPERVRRVAVMLSSSDARDPEMQARFAAFREGLAQAGWNEGRNIRFDFRWPGMDARRINKEAAELVALAPDVILTGLTPAVAAMQRLSRSIPIVFANVADPVGSGLVPSLAKPGANVTGFTAVEYAIVGKWLELLNEIAPRVKRVAFLHNPKIVFTSSFFRSLAAAAPSFGVSPVAAPVRDAADIERAIAELARETDCGLVAAPEGTMSAYRPLIIELAARHRLPAVYPFNYYPRDGGLASYKPDQVDQYRRAAGYVDRILRGTKPADLPVQAPTKFELVVNLKTAKALGLNVPATVIARADEVIE